MSLPIAIPAQPKPWATRKEINIALELIKQGKIKEAHDFLQDYDLGESNKEILNMQISDYQKNNQNVSRN